MSDELKKMQAGVDPFLVSEVDPLDGIAYPTRELKFGLVLYTSKPPSPKQAAAVFDLYNARYPGRLARYRSTAPGFGIEEWQKGTERVFQTKLLPNLRRTIHWGYAFDDGKEILGHLMMFHGYRPVSEADKASFYRFEFPWNVPPDEVREFAVEMAAIVPFDSGFGGWFFKPATHISESYDEMYAVCRRFWGIEAWRLDETVDYVVSDYKSVNWLTLIGESLRQRDPDAVEAAEQAAIAHWKTPNGVVLQAGERPQLGDQNRKEPMPGYEALAAALLPLQLTTYGTFGGQRWDEASSLAWIRRFTHPNDVT